MMQRYVTTRKTFALLISCILFLIGVSCQHIQAQVDTRQDETHLSGKGEKPETREEKTIKDVYSLIFERYVTALTAFELVEKAVNGIQSLIGKDKLSFTKTGKVLFISSSGETIRTEDIAEKLQGQEELIRIYGFVVRTNPLLDPVRIANAATKGMAELDSRSTLILHDTYKRIQEYTKGRDESIGARISIKDGVATVVSVIEKSPAFNIGILPGDQIILIDGVPTKDLGQLESDMRLFGPKGTRVTISVMRHGFTALREFTIVRDITPFVNVRYELLAKQYGYIRISSFQEKVDDDFEKAVKALQEMCKGDLKGLILDLRDNPGGLLDKAIKLAERFIQSGLIVSLDGRKESDKMKFYARKKEAPLSYPMVLLVNQWTCAGSELVAGALQDHRRSLTLGTQTFGDRTIQTFFPFRDGSALRLTTHLWKTPRGYKLEKRGIVPDVFVVGKKDGTIDSLPSDGPIISLEDTEKEGVLRIALEILKRTASNQFLDLMTAAKEVVEIEQRQQADVLREK